MSWVKNVKFRVNHGGTNRNRCTRGLVILHTQTYTNEPSSHTKTSLLWCTLLVKIGRRKSGREPQMNDNVV